MPTKTKDEHTPTEAEQVRDAPIVEGDNTTNVSTPVSAEESAEDAARRELEERVTALFAEQFAGEEGEPAEGVTPWDAIVREQVLEADRLETTYRQTLAMKEANRTLLRAFAGMGKVPLDVADYYYKPTKRGRRRSEG